jgi:hypothetical protein
VAPVRNEPKEKLFKGKLYIPCPFHAGTKWVLKAGHADGCSLDPKVAARLKKAPNNKKKGGAGADKKKEPPSKQVLQYAHALCVAMDQEEGGAFEQEEPKE